MNRREFCKASGIGILATGLGRPSYVFAQNPSIGFSGRRPASGDRKFISDAVERQIASVSKLIADPNLRHMFEICYPNTLDTTVDYEEIDGKPDTYVITGDIDAMWLRDSSAQVFPYLPLMRSDLKLKKLIEGVINRHAKFVLLDPYANAFYKDPNQPTMWQGDKPTPIPGVHERKWEIDSLCYVVRLGYAYFKETGDVSPFDADWAKAMKLIYATFVTEQRKDGNSPYYFLRRTDVMTDAPPHGGKGNPVKPVGLIASMFRPSDDATILPFLIPSNIFAAQSMRQLAEIFGKRLNDADFAGKCVALASEIEFAVKKFAIAPHEDFGPIYAYEIDGFGNRLFMDDANVPSLMSLAYLGAVRRDDPIYRATRRFLLSDRNPYFLRGRAAEGQASPHTGRNGIWPMGIILRAKTSDSDVEIAKCLQMLTSTTAGTGFIHESFDKDDASKFSRSWFAWANTLFGELIVNLAANRPHLLK
ncbi:MAG: glycoside hydrolase family 125 protein [Acidobacteria bacterium]|nr:glycoside hydrolase family 125 protein [Acidobacteriota bacterium]